MAQFGSALDWGSSGRRFKSCQPDRRSECISAAERPPRKGADPNSYPNWPLVGYQGVTGCSFEQNRPGEERIACRSNGLLFVTCNKSRAPMDFDQLSPQYSTDIQVDNWTRPLRSGRVRWWTQFGKEGWLDVLFDDGARNFCEVSSIGDSSGQSHYNAWFPNAPLESTSFKVPRSAVRHLAPRCSNGRLQLGGIVSK